MPAFQKAVAAMVLARMCLLALLVVAASYLWSVIADSSFGVAFVAVVKFLSGFVAMLAVAAWVSAVLRGREG